MSSNDSGSASHNVDLKDPFHQSSSSPFNVIDDENQSAVFPTTDDDTSESNSDNFTSLATSSSSLFPSSTTSSSQSTLNDGIQSASSTTTVSKIPERTEGETEFEPTVTAVDSTSIDTSQQVKTGKQSPAMLFGTIVIIGAVAANVIGFRHSRFAVGKDVHRAWKNHERAAGRRASSTSSSSSFEQQQQQAYRREQQQRERLERQRAAAAEAKEQVRRERVTRADREARDSSRQKYQTWEQRTYRNPDGSHTTTNTYNQETFGVEIDPALFEALFGNRNTNSRSKSQQDRNPFGMPEDVLEELLRAAQQQQADFHKQQQQQTRRSGSRTYRRVEDDFDAFRFWEQMNNAGAFGTNDFNHSGSGGGAGSRFAGMGGARTMGMNRFYSVLGLKQGASDAEIKAAYRKQVMKWHPDRYRGNNKEEAERKFREVTEAYNVLTGK